MKITLTLNEKQFTNDKGELINYYNLTYQLFDGSTLELPIKGDKAKMIILSHNVSERK